MMEISGRERGRGLQAIAVGTVCGVEDMRSWAQR